MGLQKYAGRLGVGSGSYKPRHARIEFGHLVTTNQGKETLVPLKGKRIVKEDNVGTEQGYYIKLSGRRYLTDDWYKFGEEGQRDVAFAAMVAEGAVIRKPI